MVSGQFVVFGKSMEAIAMLYGAWLIIWGIMVSWISVSNSITSLIPSFIGVPMFIFAFLSIKFPNKTKLFMHLAATLGLLCFLGGLDVLRGLINASLFQNVWADSSKIMLLITGFLFTILCIKSFLFIRQNKIK